MIDQKGWQPMWRRRRILVAIVLGVMALSAGTSWSAWAQSAGESQAGVAGPLMGEKLGAVATPPGPIAQGAARSHAPWPEGAATPEPKGQLSPVEADALADFALDVVRLVNEERARVGCPALAVDPTLADVAYAHSKDMGDNNFFDHVNLSGQDPGERMTAAGYDWQTYAENIAAGYTSPQAAVNGWLNSPGHLANIQNCSVCETGVGYYFNGDSTYGHYWTQVFGRPLDRACRAVTTPTVTPVTPTVTPATPTVTPATPTVTPVTPTVTPMPALKRSFYAPVVLHASPVNTRALVRNGDFELGPNGEWREESAQFGNAAGTLIMMDLPSGFAPHSGMYVAWLGGAYDEVSSLYQRVELPQTGGLHLRFALFVTSSEQECGYDRGLVYWDFDGNRPDVPLMEIALCGGIPYPNWEVADISLEGRGVPAGAVGRLSFEVETDESLNSNLFIDDVTIYAAGN